MGASTIAFCSFSLAAIFAPAGLCGQRDVPSDAGGPDSGAALDEEDSSPAQTTAQDVFDALQRKRPLNVPIPPASAQFRGEQRPAGALYPEGWAFVSQSGKLVDSGRWWTFVPDADGQPASLKLLPNTILESMTLSGADASSPMSFVVSGELTVFEGENLLLARLAMRSKAPQVKKAGPTEPSEPATPQVRDVAGAEAPAEDVLEWLQSQTPKRQMIAAPDRKTEDRDDSRSRLRSAGHPVIPDGSPLVDRPGRLVAQGPWWTFVFESGHPSHGERPMKLLPNRNVELMIHALEEVDSGLVFVVSGEVTAFNGGNYLLPRVVMRRIDSGNLRK